MKTRGTMVGAFLFAGALLTGAPVGAQPAGTFVIPRPGPFPLPGAPAIYKSADDLAAVLKAQSGQPRGMSVSLVQLTDRTSLNIVRRDEANGPIAHRGWSEVHYIIDGAGTAEVGGTISRGPDGATVSGAVQKRVKRGDIVFIPANSPHHYKDLDGHITYYEIRFPDVPGPAPQGPARGIPPAAAPVAGGPGIFFSGDELAATLAKAAKADSGQAVAPVFITDRFSMNIVQRGVPGPAGAHAGWNEMHYILAGSGTVRTGGKLTGMPRVIEGGTDQAVGPGDVIIVPSDTPHQYPAVSPSVTYLEVRFPNAPGEPPRLPPKP